MSSVVIAGDTSGSITLDAPAVAGTTVLTLPATTGTVFVGGQALTATTGSFSENVTLGSSVLATPSGSAPSYTCRAWVNFNGTGTVAIRASGNVSSITDNGTGDFTINFTTAMPDTNYSCVGSIKEGANTTAINSIFTPAIYATGNIRVLTNNGATPVDMVNANVTIFR
jgi:hypothetical protein